MHREKNLLRSVSSAGFLFSLLFLQCVWGCPIFRLFHLKCPGCGLTRAWLSFLSGDLHSALEQHALFLTVPLFVLLFVYSSNKKQKKVCLLDTAILLYAFLLFGYHIYRSMK